MADFWKVVRIGGNEAAPDAAEELVAVLQAILPTCGAHEVQGPDGPEWRLFFEPEELPEDVERTIIGTAAEMGLGNVRVLGVIDVLRENWQENWRQYFKPVRISPTLEVRPSWYKDESGVEPLAPGTRALYIEPGMAFGTGTHATTQLCLRQVEQLVRPGTAVLDCGTGSAILAIAAVQAGAARVVGFDIDPEVEENARLNLQLNDLPPNAVEIRIGGLDSVPPEPFNLILCNMLSREFLPLLPDLPRYLAPEGRLLLSGLLRTEEEEIRKAAEAVDLSIASADAQDEWALLVCRKQA